MKGVTFAIVMAIALLSIGTPVHSFVSRRQGHKPAYLMTTPTSTSPSSLSWNEPRTSPNMMGRVFRISLQGEEPSRSKVCLFAKGSDSENDYSKRPMVGYNDDAFGLIFLTGGVLSQDVDFIGSFVALSAAAAIFANTKGNSDTRLPGLVAMVTLAVTPIVAYVHTSILAAPQPVEIGLCLVSLVWSFVKWSQEQNE